ncbi:MAG: arginine--tRNA ligase [Silvanigrellales bacterium]|nr:arginine--tRNA ligase [Silvanigrellales bacterium]
MSSLVTSHESFSDTYRDPFRSAIVSTLRDALLGLAKEAGVSESDVPKSGEDDLLSLLSTPPSSDLGQAALPCFPFAKALKAPPPAIAAALATRIRALAPTLLSRVDTAGGYLNFHANFSEYGQALRALFENGRAASAPLVKPSASEKIVVEYAQPNTHKAMHVGHLRCIVLGDAVALLLARAGHAVVKATYPGDLGAHIAKTLWYLSERYFPAGGKLPDSNRADWLGETYVKADEAIKADTGTPKEVENRAVIAGILKELHDENGPMYDLWKTTREWSFDYMRDVYSWLGVSFDVWYTESECDKPSAALVRRKLAEGFFKQDAGAVGIDLSPWKLGFAMFLKSDGNGLYITKDLELLRRKFEDPAVTRSVYVVDARQKLHFQQLFKTAELMGYPQAAQSVHLSYETVNTADGVPFSSRALNGLKLMDLRRDMEAKVIADYLERYRGQWSDEDIRRTAEIVTIGALKYGMLKVDNNTQINFVQAEWLRLDGDTGPYLQYVHARCRSVLEKQGRASKSLRFVANEPQEQDLLFTLGRFHDNCLKAAQELRPSIVAAALHDVAKAFNRFYDACPIKTAEGDTRDSRLALVEAAAATMKEGLALLGIPAPDRM